MAVMVVFTVAGPPPDGALAAIPATPFHIRAYHLFSLGAFLVANLWNYQFNRVWTFRSRRPWWRGYRAFLSLGILAQVLGLGLLTLFMHPESFLSLPREVLDDSSFLRTRVYWAQLLTIAAVTPVTFLLNKLWTFRAGSVRT